MCAALLGLMLVCSTIVFTASPFGATGSPTAAAFSPASAIAARKNSPRSKNAFKYPPPATSTRAMPLIGFSEFAISCASARGAFFIRFASSKHTGEAASPIESFGGRSVTIGTSVLYRS